MVNKTVGFITQKSSSDADINAEVTLSSPVSQALRCRPQQKAAAVWIVKAEVRVGSPVTSKKEVLQQPGLTTTTYDN